MGEKLVIGPFNRGLRNDREPFVIDNDSFPTLVNAYQWRGRIKRKRGTALLGRLSRFLGITDGAGNITVTILPTPIATGIVSFTIGSDTFTDPGGASPVNLLTNGLGAGTLDRTTGVLTITGSQITTAVIYYPTLPVMGLEDAILAGNQFPGTIAFDTTYSYNISTGSPFPIYDVSFYKNPATGTYSAYVQKGSPTPVTWNGQNYRQFWSTNYQGAMWATNGIEVPFLGSSLGMQFGLITALAIITAGNGTTIPAVANITIGAGTPLVVGDFVFINEVNGIAGINFQTGYVTAVAGPIVTVTFSNSILGGVYIGGGIVQYLTNRSNTGVDCLRWYDGDPTNGSTTNPVYNGTKGWVNFCPPLSQRIFSIADLPQAQYYLVTGRVVLPFKDRLLVFGPVVQTSSGNPIYLQDTIIYSQNGTPYYTASYVNTPSAAVDTPASASNVFNPILVPVNQTATSPAWFEDISGFGGFISAGVDQAINTVAPNEDVLIVGFDRLQTRLIYTGNDIVPFNFFSINQEFGSASTFSVITLDKGVITRGHRGIVITSQVDCSRIDIEIPDQVFQFNLSNNGSERVTAQRDFINEWIYLTYLNNEVVYDFPNQTLQYNYRDNSWAIFNECYTTYGQFRPASGATWATLPTTLTWESWGLPWNAGGSTLRQPYTIAGNQQGFIIFRASKEAGTGEANSLYIQNIVGSTVTSPNHCLNEGDYIVINNVLGALGSQVNGKIFSVVTPTANDFILNPSIVGGSYQGGGTIQRMYVPFVQTKQFPTSWGLGRKTRIGFQQYLFSTTPLGQIQLLIFLSQNSFSAYNDGAIVPSAFPLNNGLIYSTVLYTCAESTNLGLTQANTNLQMIAEPFTGVSPQQQIWHRVNTSLIGDTVELGFTMSDAQMRDENFSNQFSEIELHGIIIDVSPSQILV